MNPRKKLPPPSMAATEKEVLPRDILQTILLLQPVKSLQRFKAVCKSWNAIISDYDFAKQHLQLSMSSKSSSAHNNILMWNGEEVYLAEFEDGNFKDEIICERPYGAKNLLCSGDGLALLSTITSSYLLLWNPCSRQHTKILCGYGFDLQSTSFGICRGPSLDDYKIVAKSSDCYAVYSCKIASWSKKKRYPFSNYRAGRRDGLFVGGFSFWFATDSQILYIDPRDEEFKKLERPRVAENKDKERLEMTILRGCLCLYDNINSATRERPRLRIWILRDNNVDSYSWLELVIKNNAVDGLSPRDVITPLFFRDENELVIHSGDMDVGIGVYGYVEKNKYEKKFDVPQSLICTKYSYVENKYEKFDVPQSLICSIEFPLNAVPCLSTLFFPMSTESKKNKLGAGYIYTSG